MAHDQTLAELVGVPVGELSDVVLRMQANAQQIRVDEHKAAFRCVARVAHVLSIPQGTLGDPMSGL